MNQNETNRQPVIQPINYLGHTYIIEDGGIYNPLYRYHDDQRAISHVTDIKDIQGKYIVSTVRNIYDWLVSYAGHAGVWQSKYLNKDHYDYNIAKRGFDYLIKSIAERDDIWPNRKLIFCQLFSSGGNFIVDWLNHCSSLDSDLAQLARKNKLKYTPNQKQRVGNRKDYKSYYNSELIDIVNQTWHREIELFGFKFDQPDEKKIVHKVDLNYKNNLRYDYENDRLYVKNKIFS